MVARLAHLQKKQQDAEAGIDTTSLDVEAELRAMDSHPGASHAPVVDYGCHRVCPDSHTDFTTAAREFRALFSDFCTLGSTLKEVAALKPVRGHELCRSALLSATLFTRVLRHSTALQAPS